MFYLKRYVEKQIKEALETSGVVVVAGPKFCGKTTTCELFAKSKYVLDTKQKIKMVEANPEAILIGENPRLIDEWQNVPDLWNCVRTEIDHREDKFGQFIFTGSSTPADKNDIYHSGSGRIVKVTMRPMSLFESGESKGIVSLIDLFCGDKKIFAVNENYNLLDTAFYICRGGWPLSLVQDRERALKITNNYCSTLFEFENSNNNKFRNKKPELFKMILRSYARNVSTEARKSVMIYDISKHEDRKIDEEVFDQYLEALNDLYIIKDIEAWNPNFRSKTVMITSPTRHFVDTSIAAYSLNMTPNDLLNDPHTFGLMFEDFAVKELSIYVSNYGGEIRHFRDGNGLECDAVIHLPNGKYALVEIKLGGEEMIKEGITDLKSIENKIAQNGQNLPSFKMIITATGDVYSRDGVYIVPINALKA
ncbi:MAG: ATP-binding protein [Bacilli bacterium]|nr:ATP-binding protein [Bacilli bacterium]